MTSEAMGVLGSCADRSSELARGSSKRDALYSQPKTEDIGRALGNVILVDVDSVAVPCGKRARVAGVWEKPINARPIAPAAISTYGPRCRRTAVPASLRPSGPLRPWLRRAPRGREAPGRAAPPTRSTSAPGCLGATNRTPKATTRAGYAHDERRTVYLPKLLIPAQSFCQVSSNPTPGCR